MSEPLWINGEYTTVDRGTIPVEDRSVLFGDGIYEVIAVHGDHYVMLEEHLDRWEASAKGLRMEQPYDRTTRVEVLRELVRRSGLKKVALYGQLSRGMGRRAHPFPVPQKPIEFWFARQFPAHAEKNYTEGVSLVTHSDDRWRQCWIKSTSLLANCLAKQDALDQNAFDSLMVNDQGIVTESTSSNFYLVKDGVIYTHPTNGRILQGCTRILTLRLANELGFEVREEQFSQEELEKGQEAFLTSTTMNIVPVTKIDGSPVGDGKVGEITGRLMEKMQLYIDSPPST